ncbi:metal-sensitive transcriptional regulator [Furfurilactobacillus sp. WILCCON 0119]|uniref:metal-sensitive transcriptional regulator n=1 Tax=Furfurilactobacillus entadae TaxID=2922307 RepID=UPI0035E62978
MINVSAKNQPVTASKQITNRLKRSRGQLDGVLRMMDEGRECQDVLVQLAAVRSSVDRAMKLVVAENIRQTATQMGIEADSEEALALQESLDLMMKTR